MSLVTPPRAVVAQYNPGLGDMTVWSTTQVPYFLRLFISACVGLNEARVRVIAPEVGGGFGCKLNIYAEEFLAPYLAKELGRPMKWTETRSENYIATIHGRDLIEDVEVGATKDGVITITRGAQPEGGTETAGSRGVRVDVKTPIPARVT